MQSVSCQTAWCMQWASDVPVKQLTGVDTLACQDNKKYYSNSATKYKVSLQNLVESKAQNIWKMRHFDFIIDAK